VPEQSLGSAAAQPEATSPSRESQLTPIAEATGEEVRQPEEDNPPEYSVQSEHDIIREIAEDIDVTPVEPEQSFTTAPVSFGPVAGSSTFRSPSPDVRVDKGKGRAEPPPSQGEGSSSRWSEREQPPHMAMASEEWAQLRGEMEVWAGFARENQEEAVRTRQDMDRIHS
jgi:hypothetical protein